eukprot:Seg1506.3 transcript_id=Seg1506.3/GoldUCD/mRNA.D3Y31 product="hypothetical protein" protein_id=Seg1506.3/GoldUCD/D3Y31
MASDMPITSHFPMRKRRALGLGLDGRQTKRATTTEAKKDNEKTPETRTKISLRRTKKHSPSDKSCNQPLKTPTRAQFPNALVRLRKTPRRLAAWGNGYASDSGPEITWDNNSPSPTKALEKSKGDGLLSNKDPEQLASILKKLSRNKVLNKEDEKTSNLFNSWMRREDVLSGRRSERLVGKGRLKKRSILNLAKPPEVGPEQRLLRKRGRAGIWNGMEFHKELSKFVENINEVGHEPYRPDTNDKIAPNEQANNQYQILDAEESLLGDDDNPLLFEDLNVTGNAKPPPVITAHELNEEAVNVMDNRVKLDNATDVKGNTVRYEDGAICNELPFDGDDDLQDDIFVDIDELPKHDCDNRHKLSTVNTVHNLIAEQDLPSFRKEVSKGSSANNARNDREMLDTNCPNSRLILKRSCKNGQQSTGNEREFASGNRSAGNYVHSGKFTTSGQKLPMNNIANRRELPEGSYTNGADLPNHNHVNSALYNDAKGKDMTAGFSADSKLRPSSCCTNSKGSLKGTDTRARASTSDARTLSIAKKMTMNPPTKPAPKNTLKSDAHSKTQSSLGTQRMNDSNVDIRCDKSSKTGKGSTEQSLQQNMEEKEKKSENLDDSLDLDCLGDLSLDEELDCCLADGKQNTGSKSKIEVVLGKDVNSTTKKQHNDDMKAEDVKKMDDIDIDEWGEDMFIDDEDLSSDVIKGMSGSTGAKEINDVNIDGVDNDLDEFLAFTFDEEDCQIANGETNTKENCCDPKKKVVQNKENHKNGNGNCGNKVTDNYMKIRNGDHLGDMDCEFDDLDLSESCLQEIEVKNDCKDSNKRNMKAVYRGDDTKPRTCHATGFRHNIRENVIHKISLKPSASTNVGRVMNICHMKNSHTDVSKKGYGVKNISSLSLANEVNDSKIRTDRNVERDTKGAKEKANFAATEVCFDKETEDDLDVMNFDCDDDDLDLIDDELDHVLKKEDLGKRNTREPELEKPLSESSRKVTNCTSNFAQPKRNVKTDDASRNKNGDILQDKADEFCADFADLLDDDFSEGCFDDLEEKADKCQTEKASLVRQNVDHLHGEKISKVAGNNIVVKGVSVMSNSNKAVSGGSNCFANNNRGKDALGVPRMSSNTINCELNLTKSVACASKVESTESATFNRNKFKFRRSAGTDSATAGSTKVNCSIKGPAADTVTNTKNVTRTSMLPPNPSTSDKRKNFDTRNETSAQFQNAHNALPDNTRNGNKSQGVKTRNGGNIDKKQILLNKWPIQNAVGANVSVIAKGSHLSGKFVAMDADDDFWHDIEIDSKCPATVPITSTQKLDTRTKGNENIDKSTVTQRYTMQDIEKKKAEAKRKLQQKMIKEKQDKALMRLMKNKR